MRQCVLQAPKLRNANLNSMRCDLKVATKAQIKAHFTFESHYLQDHFKRAIGDSHVLVKAIH